MLFNSIDFAVFLPIVFILYWFICRTIKQQNVLLFVASFIFYGWWNWRFLFFIAISTIIDYFIALKLDEEIVLRKRKIYLWISMVSNLGMLFYFKYTNFFIQSFVDGFLFFNHPLDIKSLNIILPVGISFYTFQTMSYTIDVYQRKMNSTNDFIAFGAFVSFFPQLVAGPIERASNLLPQFFKSRSFNYENASLGMRQILWGLFKKIVIADNCAEIVNLVYNNSASHSGSTLLIATVLFSFQIYGDFSGYSDIAIGTSRLFGFSLMKNFAFPYFSRDTAEFWRRWHISLTTWFRDYIYFPLGGSKGNLALKFRNTIIVFLISGFWHGANWTFIFWGLLNALYFLPLLIRDKNRINLGTVAEGNFFPSLWDFSRILRTFSLISISWIFFRAENLQQAFEIIRKIFSPNILNKITISNPSHLIPMFMFLILFCFVEWLGRNEEFALEKIPLKNSILRWSYYSFMIILVGLFGQTNETPFIYFQF